MKISAIEDYSKLYSKYLIHLDFIAAYTEAKKIKVAKHYKHTWFAYDPTKVSSMHGGTYIEYKSDYAFNVPPEVILDYVTVQMHGLKDKLLAAGWELDE